MRIIGCLSSSTTVSISLAMPLHADQVWRHGGVGREEAEGAGGLRRVRKQSGRLFSRRMECQAEEAAGRADDGCVHAEGDAGEKLLRPDARRRAVDWAVTQKGYQQRRACALAGIDPRVYRRPPTRPDDADLRARLKDLSSERRRFGYRRRHGAPTSTNIARIPASLA